MARSRGTVVYWACASGAGVVRVGYGNWVWQHIIRRGQDREGSGRDGPRVVREQQCPGRRGRVSKVRLCRECVPGTLEMASPLHVVN